jgi:hypothetical protein
MGFFYRTILEMGGVEGKGENFGGVGKGEERGNCMGQGVGIGNIFWKKSGKSY